MMVNKKDEKIFVLIPGGWHGGWAFDSIQERLEKMGHKLFPLTLPGLEDSAPDQNKIINLDTHIQFVVDMLIDQGLNNVILCGHSYGGLVITGVADRLSERINALVYIDAYIPENGDSCWKLTSDIYRDLFIAGCSDDGFTVAVPAGTDSRRVPHPMATFLQSLRLNGNYKQIGNRVFIYACGWEATPFKKQFEALKHNPEWHIETINCGHNIMREAPDRLISILHEVSIK
ncbi:alpha/beta fold hydrolase [Arachidicoccus terrestris]|uniref:alpha/beta fold hydrolase n=1 Tax=Arachidicoccus terrestris TaxID=2875539 RepID=UPI001CC4CC50|nr:alpha/beta hydrolase [Arachidicoccus terrestris]UAY54157.1 alpha/beta hydrolase [Arachidicoccus terrestris]